MDFQLSMEWLREFVDVRLTPEALAERLSEHSVSVERMHRLDEGLDHIVVGRVERITKHPNADKLRIADVSVGGAPVRVVCGGTNLREGMRIAYASPGARVRWHGEGDLVTLAPTDMRGVRSDGMICASSEIGLGEWFTDGEREILDLTALVSERQVGKPLGRALGLDDVILEVEVTTNRPDLMCVAGLAREVAAITGAKMRARSVAAAFRPPSGGSRTASDTQPKLSVRVADRHACPWYTGTILEGVTVGPSPWWMRRRLIAGGIRPIVNVVDITNYVALELGQPLHAFDASTLQAASRKLQVKQIIVRRAQTGERIRALDGAEHTLTPVVLIIADRERPIAIAGVIGGAESAVHEETTTVVLESASFDPLTVRRGARSLHIRTESSLRFEKGLAREGVEIARQRAVQLLTELAGGQPVGAPTRVGTRVSPLRPISLDVQRTAAAMGIPITPTVVRRALTRLGCRVTGAGFRFRVTPPWWRRGDLEAEHDLVEEVARIHGYQRIPAVLPADALPASAYPPQPSWSAFDWEDRARRMLVDVGATELRSFSFASLANISASGFTADQCVAIENPLSEDSAFLRPSMLTTLLPLIAENQGHTPHAVLFEMGNIYIPKPHAASDTLRAKERSVLPLREEMRLTVAAYGRLLAGGHVMKVKGLVERLFHGLAIRNAVYSQSEGCVLGFGRGAGVGKSPVCLWHPGRTMDVCIGDALVGVIGEVHPAVVERFGIDARVAVADLDWDALLPCIGPSATVREAPAFPPVKRDLAVIVDRWTIAAALTAVFATSHPLLTDSELFDVFEGPGVPAGKKSMAFHLTYAATDRTLTSEEIDAAHTRVLASIRERFGAEERT